MEQSSKEIRNKQEGASGTMRKSSEDIRSGDVISQEEIMKRCRVELSMEEYSRLARRALREGCTPEELVAREIAQLVHVAE